MEMDRTVQKEMAEGLAEGRAEGRAEVLIALVNQGILPIDIAAQQLGETEEQFSARLQK